MKQTALSRRAFLAGAGRGFLSRPALGLQHECPRQLRPTPSQPEREPAASPDASSEMTREPILTADEFP